MKYILLIILLLPLVVSAQSQRIKSIDTTWDNPYVGFAHPVGQLEMVVNTVWESVTSEAPPVDSTVIKAIDTTYAIEKVDTTYEQLYPVYLTLEQIKWLREFIEEKIQYSNNLDILIQYVEDSVSCEH